jgi:hypothetical protein
MLGEKWKALGEKQRQPYEAKAAADKKRYEEEKAAYQVRLLTPARMIATDPIRLALRKKRKRSPTSVLCAFTHMNATRVVTECPLYRPVITVSCLEIPRFPMFVYFSPCCDVGSGNLRPTAVFRRPAGSSLMRFR